MAMDSLKRARKAAGLSLAELAARTGLHPVSIARAERPALDPSVSTLIAIAKAVNVPVCELLDERVNHARQHGKQKAKR
jgi:transcriptional regulator with XRE-family HTH domain